MLPLSERDKKLSQSPYFFKRWRERRDEIGYIHHQKFISEFYEIFQDPTKSLLMKDPRTDRVRFGDVLCIFKNSENIFICVILKSGDYYEMVNFKQAKAWEIEFFNKKEELRERNNNGSCIG